MRVDDIYYITNSDHKMVVCLECSDKRQALQEYEKVKDLTDLDVEIKKHREKRSLNANSYMWVLLDKMAKKLANGETKESLYQEYIKAMGIFTPLPIKADAVDDFAKIWAGHGLGWIIQVVDESKLRGYKLIHAYQGSSTYNTEQMTDLINLVVADAKELGIETKTPDELADMMSLWETQGE